MSIISEFTPARGCGTRVKGGIYAEVHLSNDGGIPLMDCIFDPPIRLDFDALGVTSLGTKLLERGGVFHVVDMVGACHYPNVADFVEEALRFGVSRRLSRALDLSKIGPASRLLLAHPRAYIENFSDYAAEWVYSQASTDQHPSPRCPKSLPEHDQVEAPDFCVGAWWQDLEGGVATSRARSVKRQMPSFSYTGFSRPAAVVPKYCPAVFASFPISRLVGISDGPEEDAKTASILSQAKVPTAISES